MSELAMPGAAPAVRLRRRITSVGRMVVFPAVDAFGGGVKLLCLWAAAGVGRPARPMRFVWFFLFALGKNPLCPLVGFSFRVGDCVAGRGSFAGLSSSLGCGGASSSSGWLWRARLGVLSPCFPSTRLPMFVQRLKSISGGALGWWILRLQQCLGPVDGRSGGRGFGCGWAVRLGASESRWKMNRASRGFYVIFFFVEVLCVSLGDALCSNLINISSLSKKKKKASFGCRSGQAQSKYLAKLLRETGDRRGLSRSRRRRPRQGRRRPFISDLPSCASRHRPPREPPPVPMALVGRRKARGLLGKWKSKKARGPRNNGSKKRPAPKVVVWRGFSRFSIMAYSKSPEQDICCICGDDDRMEHLCPYNHIFGRYFSDTCRGECPPGEHRITPRARRKFLRRFVRVSNLPPGFRVWELEGLFSPFGPLLMWDIPRLPGDMCGCRIEIRMSFGYLVFKKREDGKRAIDELNGYEARGHKLRVDWVYPSCV